MRTPYFSRNPQHKFPFGTAAEGEEIRFRLILPLDCFSAGLIVQKADGETMDLSLSKEENYESDGVWWSCRTSFKDAGLYFYKFWFDTPFGHNILTRGVRDESIMSPDGRPFQLTVTKSGVHTPNWLAGGVIYQIFPDRFCKKGSINNPFKDRFVHEKFGGTPAWRQIPGQSDVLNNDYFGGNLKGITSKLPYLEELGVTCIYLNPIFEAHSNHRYNTADYFKIDPMLGDENDFKELCKAAAERGIRIVLDGVFSHTGEDSIYFNKNNRYKSVGAAQDRQSPYYSWYTFSRYPDRYNAWWGIKSLPEVNEENPEYLEFITGENGVARYWLRLGASGWRLDVADELPDLFIDRFNSAVKKENPYAIIIGEVWEDASNKESYGHRRRYFQGGQLDSVMNYPFYEAVLKFLRGGTADKLMEAVCEIVENYPPEVTKLLMNHMGTHDTERLITALCGERPMGRGREWQSCHHMSEEELLRGKKFVKLAAALQYTLPGVPCVYYGDELGEEGYSDPFNRGVFDFEKGDKDLCEFYKIMGKIRRDFKEAFCGEFVPVFAEAGHIAYIRKSENISILVGVNRWCDEESFPLPEGFENCEIMFGRTDENRVYIPPEGIALLIKLKRAENNMPKT